MESWILTTVKCHWPLEILLGLFMGICAAEPLSLQVLGSWVDYISHEMLKCSPSMSFWGLRALQETWSRGEALPLRGRKRLIVTLHKSYRRNTLHKSVRKNHAVPLTKPLSISNKACLRPKLAFFPLSRFSTLLLRLLSWAQLKDSNGCFSWNFEHISGSL